MARQILGFMAIALSCSFAMGEDFADNVGNHLQGGDLHDFFQSQGFDHLDIVNVQVTNDATHLIFNITANADLDATTWGKYVVGFDTGANAGDNSVDPGSWNRNVDWGRGITGFIGSWADDGGSGAGAELRQFDGSNWNLTDATYGAGTEIFADDSGHAAGVQILGVTLSSLGLSFGDTIEFDVFTTGGNGGDPGVDHLSRFDFSTDDWANQSTAGDFLSYTIVPEPSSMGILAVATIGFMVRRRRR